MIGQAWSTAVPVKTYIRAFNATISVISGSSIVDVLEFQKNINVTFRKCAEIHKPPVLPAEACIQRLYITGL
jgi:hypothetical protein